MTTLPPLDEALTRYNKEHFFGRLQYVLAATDNYGGALETAFASAETMDPPAHPAGNSANSDHHTHQNHQIRMIAERARNAGISSAVIEAAHMYMYDDLGELELQENVLSQCQHAAALTSELEDEGIHVRQIMFVDDYNPDPVTNQLEQRLDIDELVRLAHSAGYAPEMLLREAAMAPLAINIMRFMRDHQRLIKLDSGDTAPDQANTGADIEEGSRLMLARRNIELYRPDEDMVTCAMLDAALTLVKFRFLGEAVINILPRRPDSHAFSYNGQQRKMRTIIGEHLNVRVSPVFNLFTGDRHADSIAAGAHHALRKPH